MKAYNAQTDALSDKELNTVSGGKKERVQVTQKQYDQITDLRMMFANLK